MSGAYDAVVAGSGAGGACVAGKLAEAGLRVLVLERGGPAVVRASAPASVRLQYARGGLAAAAGRALIPVPTGSCVGGTTAINSGTCMRAPSEALARWEDAFPGFSAAAFEARLDEAWAALKVKRTAEKTMSGSSRLVLAGMERLGVPAARLHRAEEDCAGEGRCCFVCPRGAKVTSDKAFLSPLPEGRRPELWTRAALTGVRAPRRTGEAVRVTVGRGRAEETVETPLLVLACGALETPYFVRAFKLGPAWGAAGDGLSLHPAIKLFGLFPDPVLPAGGVPQGVGALHPGDPLVRLEGVATPPELTALTMPAEGARLRWWLERLARLATFGLMVKDEARGSVRYPLGSSWPLLRYAPSEADLGRLRSGARLAAEAFFAAGAARVLLPMNVEANEAASPAQAEELLRRGFTARSLHSMAFHPLGTCGLGRVVGPDLRLCPGVYVCDGSVVPESLGVNPQVTIYAFALELAGRLAGGKG